MKRTACFAGILLLVSTTAFCGNNSVSKKLNIIKCDNYNQMESYFRYESGCPMIVSGHRGGVAPGYPENSIEAFEYTLSKMPSFFEIDPRMTKDSVMVLMHDAVIDRVSTGKGLVKEYTYEELQQFDLVDRWGNPTPYKIPKVEDVIRWSQGKTILNFDKKDVTRDVLIRLVNRLGAKNVIYTVHTPEDALYCCSQDSDAHLSAWIKDMDAFRAYEATGIPWSRFIVYVVSPTMNPANKELYDALHAVGVRCMISMSPTHDKLPTTEERIPKFKTEVAGDPDIIETDFPTEFIGLY